MIRSKLNLSDLSLLPGNYFTTPDNGKPGWPDPNSLERIWRLQHHHVGMVAFGNPVIVQVQSLCAAIGYTVEHFSFLLFDEDAPPHNRHMSNIQHLTFAKRVPWIHHTILP